MSQVAGKAACAGEYGIQVQVRAKGGAKVIVLATVRKSPEGMRFFRARFNANQIENQRYNPQVSIHPEDVEMLCSYIKAAAASIEQGTTIEDGWESTAQFTRPMYQGDAPLTKDTPPF